MSKPADPAGAVAELRLQLDELATTLLLNGPDASLVSGLKQLADVSKSAGFSNIAQIASGLITKVSAGGNIASLEAALRDGFAQVQSCLETPENPATPVSSIAAAINPLAQDPELVGDFVMESREHLTAIENHMLTLERNPEEKEAVHAVFRGFHTIKGLAGFLEFMPIRDVAHEVETLLDNARNGKLAITGSVVDVVLESVDCL
jgi:two-component system chemotaxis sensor kinase CheA